MDEQQAFKCPKHPSKRRKTGICPKCLRDRLVTLCPECANARPCACCPPAADTSSSSNSSSPALLKSRSVAISFLRSRSRHVGGCHVETETENAVNNNFVLPKVGRSKHNFWSMFNVNKSKRGGGMEEEMNINCDGVMVADDNSSMMMRSRSVAVGAGNRFAPASSKQKGWYFPSPINVFRHSKAPRSVPVT